MHYREYVPSNRLRPLVRCIWQLTSDDDSSAAPERIIPDGCPEIIVNRADRFGRITQNGIVREQPDVLMVGQISRAIRVVPTGTIDLVGIRFQPHGLHRLLGVDMDELTDLDIDLGQVSRSVRNRICESLQDRQDKDLVGPVESVLATQLNPLKTYRSWRLDAFENAFRMMENGSFRVDRACAILGMNRRSFERSFRRCVGLSPKTFHRIRRLQSVVRCLDGDSNVDWASMAARQGYADQPHLIREFKAIAGICPTRYVAERAGFAANFYGDENLSHLFNPQS